MTKQRKLPITVIIPTRNEVTNLPCCLKSLRHFDQVIVVDSQSNDGTISLAEEAGAEVHQFVYTGGWPKKRQWAMDNLSIRNPWTLLLDADERVSTPLLKELSSIVRTEKPHTGYWIALRLLFLGRELRYGGTGLKKLSFFRTGEGRFECLVKDQDKTMADMEIHEHIMVEGSVGECKGWIRHENLNNLHRYIEKHNEYSSWSAAMLTCIDVGDNVLPARLLGNQAERRRWLNQLLWRMPCAGVFMPMLRFFWFYLVRFGFLDGTPGFYYSLFKGIQAAHIAAKVQEKHRLPGKKE